MGDVVAGHRQDRDLGDRARAALEDAGPLVQACEVGIEVAREALAAGDLALGGGELPHGFTVACHIGQDDQHVFAKVKSQVFGHGQGCTRGDDALDDRVIRKVQQHDDAVHRVGADKRIAEVFGDVVLDTHRGKDDREVGAIGDRSLLDDLDGQLVVLHAGAREDRQLLAADQGGQAVDGRDAGADIVARIDAADRVDRRAVDIAAGDRVDRAEPVDRPAQTVQHPAEQFGAEIDGHRAASQHGAGVFKAQAVAALKHLDHAAVFLDHDGTAKAGGAVIKMQLDHLVVLHAGHALEHDERAVDLGQTNMFQNHFASPPSPALTDASLRSISLRSLSKPLMSSFGIVYLILTSSSNRPVASSVLTGTCLATSALHLS